MTTLRPSDRERIREIIEAGGVQILLREIGIACTELTRTECDKVKRCGRRQELEPPSNVIDLTSRRVR